MTPARLGTILVLLGLGLMSPVAAEEMRCLAPASQQSLVAQLFFGLSLPKGGHVSADAWRRFLRDSVTPRFPDGFTIADAEGQWRDPDTGKIEREKTKVLVVAIADSAGAQSALQTVVDAYRVRFHQKSVGVIINPACSGF